MIINILEMDYKKYENDSVIYEEYLRRLEDICHFTYVPINYLIDIYQKQYGYGQTNQTIIKKLLYLKEYLLIKKIHNRWICSKERCDVIDFNNRFNLLLEDDFDLIKYFEYYKNKIKNI